MYRVYNDNVEHTKFVKTTILYFSFIHLRDVRAPVILSSFDSVDSAPSLKKLRYVFCINVTYFVTGRVGVRHTLVL